MPDLASESSRLFHAVHSPAAAERTAALEELGGRLYRALWPRVRGEPRLEHLAADCSQDALLTIWQRLEAGQGPERPESFLAWSLRVATHKLVDELRRLEPTPKAQKAKRVALSQQIRLDQAEDVEGRGLDEQLPDPGAADADTRLAYAEIHALLQEIHRIPSVSTNSRIVLLKGYLEDWEDAELAEHLATSLRNVHVIRCRDLAKLRLETGFVTRLRSCYAAPDEEPRE